MNKAACEIAYGTAIGLGISLALAPIHPVEKADYRLDLSTVEIAASLPQPVKDVAAAAVALRSNKFIASGARIGKNTFLTAGHMLLPDEKSTTINCKGMKAIARNPALRFGGLAFKGVAAAAFLDDKRDYGVITTAPNSVASANEIPSFAVPDRQKNLIGKEVFVIDYQPVVPKSGQKDVRSPDVKIDRKDVNTERDRTTPAIIGGIVIKDSTEMLSIVTGINHNYSTGAPDIESRSGGSGGAVVTPDGKLVGVLATVINDITLQELRAVYAVEGDVPHHVGDTYQVSGIQKITQQRLAALPAAQPC